MQSNQFLAQLIGSRICHDLVSPIGAIGNGLELMQMTQSVNSAEMALVQDSLNNASARIRYFRLAFGMACERQTVGSGELSALLGDLSRLGRIHYDWAGPDQAVRAEVRALCLAAMCLETALPYGDRISFAHQDGRWQVTGTGRKLLWQAEKWEALERGEVTAGAANDVQFALLPGALDALQRSLRIDASDQLVSLSF